MLETRSFGVREKEGAGLVTDVDMQLERNFRGYLTELIPGSQMMGEEEGGSESEWTW